MKKPRNSKRPLLLPTCGFLNPWSPCHYIMVYIVALGALSYFRGNHPFTVRRLEFLRLAACSQSVVEMVILLYHVSVLNL